MILGDPCAIKKQTASTTKLTLWHPLEHQKKKPRINHEEAQEGNDWNSAHIKPQHYTNTL